MGAGKYKESKRRGGEQEERRRARGEEESKRRMGARTVMEIKRTR